MSELNTRVKGTRLVKGTFEVEFDFISRLQGKVSSIPVDIGGLGWSCTVGKHFQDKVRYLSVEISAHGRNKLKHFQCHADCEVVLKNQSTGPDVQWNFSETFSGTYRSSFKKNDLIKWAVAKQEFASENSIIIQVSISPGKATPLEIDVDAPGPSIKLKARRPTHYDEMSFGNFGRPLLSEMTKAIRCRDHELLADLTAESPDVLNTIDKTPWSYPLVEAIEQGDVKCIEVILNNEALEVPNDASRICAAVRLLQRAFDTWDCLVKHGTNINATDGDAKYDETSSALHYACRSGGSRQLIEFLIGQGCLVINDNDNKLPHHSAVEYCLNTGALRALLDHDLKMKVTYFDAHYLNLAQSLARHGDLELLSIVFQHNRDQILRCDTVKEGILHNACARGSAEVVQFLLGQGCSIRKCQKFRFRMGCFQDDMQENVLPHHVAAHYNNTGVLNVLLQHDLQNHNMRDANDYSRLAAQIAKHGNVEILELIFEHYRENILHYDAGDQLLQEAIRNSNTTVFRYALNMGCGYPQETFVQHGKIKSLNAAIKHEDPTYFELILKLLNPDMAEMCTVNFETELQNTLENDSDVVSFCATYPVITAIKAKQVDRLAALLSVGFSPNVFIFADHSPKNGDMFEKSNLNRYFREHRVHRIQIAHTVLSYTMFKLPWNESDLMLRTIQVLLEHAQVSGDVPQINEEEFFKMPPIVAAVWKMGSSFRPSSMTTYVLRLLIDEGACFDYRAPDSIFASPDCALIAAFFGNVTLLAHSISSARNVSSETQSSGIEHAAPSSSRDQNVNTVAAQTFSNAIGKGPLNLLKDMMKFQYDEGPHWPRDSNLQRDSRFPRSFRDAVARSVDTALKFADARDSQELGETCEKLDLKFRFARYRRSRNSLRFATDADTAWVVPNSEDKDFDDSEWERVRKTVKTLSTLQHMCRAIINRQLVQCDPRLTRSLENAVNELPIPDVLKDFLY